jgi:hypothetical protein
MKQKYDFFIHLEVIEVCNAIQIDAKTGSNDFKWKL